MKAPNESEAHKRFFDEGELELLKYICEDAMGKMNGKLATAEADDCLVIAAALKAYDHFEEGSLASIDPETGNHGALRVVLVRGEEGQVHTVIIRYPVKSQYSNL